MEDAYKGQVENPLTLNRYVYTANNPLRYSDPTGHSYTWSLNLISQGYNSGLFSAADASMMVFGSSALSFLAPDFTDTPDPGEPNFRELYTPFHEIAQINVAKQLYQKYGQNAELEKKLATGETEWFGLKNKYYEADIVLGNKVWEVKPLNGQDPKAQLELYKKLGNLKEGEKLKTMTNIPVFDNVKMEITFPEAGVARYQMYAQGDGGVRRNLSTVGAAIAVARALLKSTPAGRRLSPGF
ncbi:hypothetical protein BAG01nite_39930 [Brevibacillus agri]|uniref:RHS repeat-associated core domain-containing protein n=1 Tax=Brevibacillus agri TaxID=51101 RepID=A0A3M8BDE3_9BACL|nr:hypothetical protein [Brevibacillus agri]EJL44233.1 hypothetical protein PMI08_02035 [Brevibacillus sp. CF112]MED3501197.1 hypothetical protein [Brevibacillus agri]QAV15391.1 hypothetical protein BA6348_23045 [Brevibacillus agri]RNB61313.1 hypothetical protein EB820_01395 [Brevibacillus agri]GED27891.1 hypothetical protein BAG01nite_39930 [Brevibacillus agri]